MARRQYVAPSVQESITDTGPMRRLLALVLAVATMCAACTSGSDEPKRRTHEPVPSRFESLNLQWPKAQGKLDRGQAAGRS